MPHPSITRTFGQRNFYIYIYGASGSPIGTGVQSLMQNCVAGAMRGRVMSLYGVIFRGGPALGARLMGVFADVIGLRVTFAAAAGFTVLALLWIPRSLPRMAAALSPRMRSTGVASRRRQN